MTKTQVTHLQTRLVAALDKKCNEDFVMLPTNYKIPKEELDAKILEIASELKIHPRDYHYNISHLASQMIKAGKVGSLQEINSRNAATKVEADKYKAIKMEEINQILDEAVLGDSADALKALKEFQGNL